MLFFNEIKQIEINPTELCNLACSFCPRSTFYPNVTEHMSVATAIEIKNQMVTAGFRGVLSITGRGEPTLHPFFKEFVSAFVGYDWTLKMHTNGKRFEQHKEFILNNFQDIHFNCYETDAREIAEEYKSNCNVKVINKPINESNAEWVTNRAGSFPTNELPMDQRCDVPFHKMFIDIDGTYRLCCEDWKHKVSLGNVFKQNIVEYIEDNNKLSSYRKKLVEGNRSSNPCLNCNYNINDDKYDKILKLDTYKKMVELGEF